MTCMEPFTTAEVGSRPRKKPKGICCQKLDSGLLRSSTCRQAKPYNGDVTLKNYVHWKRNVALQLRTCITVSQTRVAAVRISVLKQAP